MALSKGTTLKKAFLSEKNKYCLHNLRREIVTFSDSLSLPPALRSAYSGLGADPMLASAYGNQMGMGGMGSMGSMGGMGLGSPFGLGMGMPGGFPGNFLFEIK